MAKTIPSPEAFKRTPRQSSREDKINSIVQQATLNPSWTKKELLLWTMQQHAIAERTARIYFYEAKNRFNRSSAPPPTT
jgi:hypothetical protein